jgi:hypothetical protein
MKTSFTILSVALLALPALVVAQTVQPKPASKKSSTSSAKSASTTAKPVEQPPKSIYAELTIGELVAEDPSRWSDKMGERAAIGGFVTQIAKVDDGDTEIRICENPKIEGMDRTRCIIAKCIPKIPCDLPQIGRPITVKGLPRYDAKVGTHWWEIHPIEQIEK